MKRMTAFAFGLSAALIALAAVVLPGHAADKSEPPPQKIDAAGNVKAKSWTGCYVDAGAVGFFVNGNDTVKAFSIGAGCDYQLDARFVVGVGGSYMIGTDDARAIDAFVRAGILLNEHLLLYVRGGLLLDGESPKFGDSIATIGAGFETSASSSVTIGAEAFTNAREWGDASEMPNAWIGRGYLRYKFNAN